MSKAVPKRIIELLQRRMELSQKLIAEKQQKDGVVPVRRGYWEQGDMYDIGDICSECCYDSFLEPCQLKFCPNCGAYMGGSDNGE